ncbi:ankyrin repeat domain-containing protein [Pyrenophora tritici-repentis]|nr:ankyrin repeat domain-containing protein [Pyrenophora tritici-repentis]KAI0615636.1 ankyrin repeat domain-containing protein [Pyrenophora tritici-repentis]KAI0619872.1 ankyrin repeat domain-containing protein [Pyrenophora tritici-repentis]
MAGLGEAASVIAVLQLSGKVFNYIGTAKDSSEDRKRLREEVRACRDILRMLNEDYEDAKDTEDSDIWAATIHTLQSSNGPLSRLQSALIQVERRLSSKNTFKTTLKWPFQEKEVRKIIEAIEHEKSLLVLAQQRDGRKHLLKIQAFVQKNNAQLTEILLSVDTNSKNVETNFHGLADQVFEVQTLQQELYSGIKSLQGNGNGHKDTKLRKSALKWISSEDYAYKHTDILSKREEGTGKWFLESGEYKAWLDHSDPQRLLCTGVPGAGKTTLTSIIIDDLQMRYQNDQSVVVAYIYCDYRTRDEHNVRRMLSCLLKQLAERPDSLPGTIAKLYRDNDDGLKQLSLVDITRSLQSLAASFSRVFILIDALDECNTADRCRTVFLWEIFKLQRISNTSLLATSRNIPEVVDMFDRCQPVEIRASTHDVRTYIEGNLDTLPRFVQSNVDLQEQIKDGIAKAVDGMFLLAKLYLASLSKKRSVNAVRKTLKEVSLETKRERTGSESEAYDYAYHVTMQRIEEQGSDQAELAKEVLAWLTCSKQPMTTEMLQKALGVRDVEYELSEDDYPDIGSMVSACAGLVELVDRQDGSPIIRLVHYTTQEYFERTASKWFPEAEAMIAISCIAYLSLDEFGTEALPEFQPFPDDEWGADPFYSYAASYWGVHAHHLSPNHPRVVEFLSRPHHVGRNGLWQWDLRGGDTAHHPLATTALHLTAYFGLEEMTAKILGNVPYYNEREDKYPTEPTPLMLAVMKGHEGVVRSLLERGAKITRSSKGTALYRAVESNNEAMVRLLVPYCSGNLLEAPDHNHPTVLHVAARRSFHNIVVLLLEHGLHVDERPIKDYIKDGSPTPLYSAAIGGDLSMIKLLIERGADPNAKFINYRHLCEDDGIRRVDTPLNAAVREQRIDVVMFLLDSGARIDNKLPYVDPAMVSVCENRNYEMLKLLVEVGGFDVNRSTLRSRPLIVTAARCRWEEGLSYLLSVGANVYCHYELTFSDVASAWFRYDDERKDAKAKFARWVLENNVPVVSVVGQPSEPQRVDLNWWE